MKYDAVLTDAIHRQAAGLLLQHVRAGRRQEELCFALWRPGTGAERQSALVFEIIPPGDGERILHGGASFQPAYLTRSIRLALQNRCGLAFMHSHLSPGWQGMSAVDVVAERDRIAPPARASRLPLVGLTLGTDGSWSARFWLRGKRGFKRRSCEKVRVVGGGIRLTWDDTLRPPPERRPILQRTIDTWGARAQQDLGRLRVGIVGLGSVGCIVAEALARIGVSRMVLIDADQVEEHNLDRLLYAGVDDVGAHKVPLVARHLKRSATAADFEVDARVGWIQERPHYRAALDCDILFAAVDRPLPKDVLNHIAYAHCIPVVFGGIFAARKADGRIGQAAWSAVVAGPGQCCLRCDGQYTSSDVVMERDGSLDDPSYVHGGGQGDQERRNENVFPFSANAASYMVLEMIRQVVREDWWPATTKLHYSFVPNRLSTAHEQCRPHCSFKRNTAAGDLVTYPFIVDPVSRPWKPGLTATLAKWIRRIFGQ